ncbi:MAG: hypothetical protein K2Y12_08800 [Chitinophagaceae bacterium]|nr:hypothetical protein [Chitinophagaceae bacterium]
MHLKKTKSVICFAILVSLVGTITSCQKQVDYSGDIRQLRSDVLTLQRRTDSLMAAMSALNNSINSVNARVDSIKTQITSILLQINTLNTQLAQANANITNINSQIASLNQQLASLLAQLNDIIAQLSATPTSLANGLIAYYPFNGSVNDESGNNRNGQVVGQASLIPDRLGISSKAYSFSTVNDYILVPQTSQLGLTNKLSVSFWFSKPENYSYSTLIIVGNGTNFSNGFFVGLDQNDGSSGPDKYRLIFNISNGPIAYADILKSQFQTWCHVAATYDGSQLKLYFNSQIVATSNFTGQINSPNGNLNIVKWDNPSLPNRPERRIDEIRLYNRVIAQNEINYLSTK